MADDDVAELQAKLEQAERERDHWRDRCIHAMVTGEYPVSPHDHDPAVATLRQAAEYAFHGTAYAEKAKALAAAESALAAAQGAWEKEKHPLIDAAYLLGPEGFKEVAGSPVSRSISARAFAAIEQIDRILSAEPRAAPPALPAELSGKGEQREEVVCVRSENATHRCRMCRALWRQLSAISWSLVSEKCGPCCDNAPMGEQIGVLLVCAFSGSPHLLDEGHYCMRPQRQEHPEPGEAKKEEGT